MKIASHGAEGGRSDVRLIVLQVVTVSLLLTLLVRLWYVEIGTGEHYARAATANDTREVIVPAVRGDILDDEGRPLVDNRTTLVISVSRNQMLSQEDGGKAVLTRLAGLLGMDYTDVANRVRLCTKDVGPPCWNGLPFQPIPVVTDAKPEQALQIVERQEDYPGVTAEMEPVRDYPAPERVNAAQLLGYLSPTTERELQQQEAKGVQPGRQPLHPTDLVGRAGLERTYDQYLRGRDGVRKLAVDSRGRVTGTVSETQSVPGDHLVTSIDAKVQAATEQQLQAAIQRARTPGAEADGNTYKADSGAAVVMDVKTGRIIAMASYPTYDPSIWTGGISAGNYQTLSSPGSGIPLLSRAYQGEFSPGSTFKAVSASAAGMDGYSLEHGTYDCPSAFSIGGRSFGNFESESFGPISMEKALAVSCDTVWYQIAYSMWLADGGNKPVAHPKDPIQTMAKAYGLGKPTGVDLPGEASGLIEDRTERQADWDRNKDTWCRQARDGFPDTARTDPARAAYLKQIAAENCTDGYRFRAGDAAIEAIGQGGVLVTPLQLAQVYAAVANGGTLWKPTIGKAVVSPDGKLVKEIQPQAEGRVPVSPDVLAFLRKAFTGVTTSGTAAWRFAGWPQDRIAVASKTGTAEVFGKQPTSWFASFAPAGDPRYVIVMMVSQGGTGSGASAPSVRKIYEALYGVADPGTTPVVAGGATTGSVVDPARAIFPTGAPPTALPVVRPDGTIVEPDGPPAPPPASEPPAPARAPAASSSSPPPGRPARHTT